jgi:hypothetical protein
MNFLANIDPLLGAAQSKIFLRKSSPQPSAVPAARASPDYDSAALPVWDNENFFPVIDPPRGRPVGGGGVHHNNRI